MIRSAGKVEGTVRHLDGTSLQNSAQPVRSPNEWRDVLRFLHNRKTGTLHMCSLEHADRPALVRHLRNLSRLTAALVGVSATAPEGRELAARIGRELDAARRALRPHIQPLPCSCSEPGSAP